MSLQWIIFLIFLAVYAVIPYFICLVLKFALWKHQFSSKPTQFFSLTSYKDILLRVPAGLNQDIVISIGKLTFKLWPVVKFGFHDLSISILVRDEFNQWKDNQIDLLKMLDDIRTQLRRQGQANLNTLASMWQPEQKRSFLQRTARNMLSTTMVELENTELNFYFYKDAPLREGRPEGNNEVDFQNIKKLHRVINSERFLKLFLNFRLHFPESSVNVVTISDEDVDFRINSTKCLLLNPCFQEKRGVLEEIEILLKLPLNPRSIKVPGNYDIHIKGRRANLDVNRKLTKQFIKWFVCLYTLKKIIQVAKNIILKTNHQEEILAHQVFPHEVAYDNYQDSVIPKRLKISVQEGINLIVTDDRPKLFPFLEKKGSKPEFSMAKVKNFTFELLRLIHNKYYIVINSEQGDLAINENAHALRIERYQQEINFTFKKEQTDLPVKKSCLHVENKIVAFKIEGSLSPTLAYYWLQAYNIYKAMVSFSSVKAKINGTLLNEDFLKNNIFQHRGGPSEEERILQIYKPQRYQDRINHIVQVAFLDIKLFRWHPIPPLSSGPYTSHYLKGAGLKSKSLKLDWKMGGGKIHSDFSAEKLALFPLLNQHHLQGRMRHKALFLADMLKYATVVHQNDIRRDVEQNLVASSISVNVNYEVALDLSPELIDLWILVKHFSTKWNSKYKTKPTIPRDITQRQVRIDHFTLSWNLSCTRFISFSFFDLHSEDDFFELNGKKYVSAQGQQRLRFRSSEAEAVHCKHNSETIDEFYRCCFVPIENELLCHEEDFEENITQETILGADDFELRFENDPQQWALHFFGSRARLFLPDKYHFCAVIYEMQKQYFHARNYFGHHRDARLQTQKFQFKKWRSSVHPDIEHLGERTSEEKRPKTIQITVQVREPEIEVEENNLKKVFVDKSDIVEILQQRSYCRVKQRPFQKLWERMQEMNLNNKYLFIKGRNLYVKFELPQELRDNAHVLDVIKSLDEGRQFITPQTFTVFNPGTYTVKFDYGYLMARNLQKPLAELWKFNFKLTFIVAHLNPIENLDLFTCTLTNKVFQRFGMPQNFNRLLPKQYYDSTLDMEKLRLNIQGQQSFLFFNDIFQQLISRFIWEDISRGRDPLKKYLKYLMGLDRQRARLHGKYRVSLLKIQISMYPRRNFSSNDPFFLIQWHDMVYSQAYQKQQVCMRDFIMRKEPLQQFESLFMKLPIVEFTYQVDYNDGQTLNHFFNQQQVSSMQDWENRVKKYMARSQSVHIRLNIPTLGKVNETQHKCLYLPLLMQAYAENSPIPLVHYQRSHMQFLYEFMKEFQANRIDISGKVYKKMQLNKIGRNPRYTLNFLPPKLEKSKTKFQCFINHGIFLISDFKEAIPSTTSSETDVLGLDDQIISPDEIGDHSKKDTFLRRYNGIIFTHENFVVQSEFTYRPNDVNWFEINDSLASFNLFRLSRLTSKNLFKIEHKIDHPLRNLQSEQSLDKFSNFCRFFGLDEDQTLANNAEQVKAKFPQYPLPPVELVEQEMAIIDNTFYPKSLATQALHYDPELKYKQLLGAFKTLFPRYILTNDQLQKQIQRIDSFKTAAEQAPSPGGSMATDLMDEFIFSENDTLGTVIHSEYRQDSKIRYKSMKQPQAAEKGKKPGDDLIHVKHLIDISGVRFLYTKKIIEVLHHHLIKGFDFQRFRKQYSQDSDERNMFLEFDNEQAGRRGGGKNHPSQRVLNFKAFKKEAIVVVRLEQAQINFQDNLTESQMLISSPQPVVLVIFAYNKNQAPSLLQNEQMQFFKRANQRSDLANKQNEELPEEFENELKKILTQTEQEMTPGETLRVQSIKQSIQKREGLQRGYFKDPLNRDSLMATTATYTGYQFSSNKDVVKYEMEIQVREMDVYVAPTFINLENPTFWTNQNSPFTRQGFSDGENLLQKIFLINDISFNFGFLKQDFVDNQNPRINLMIIVERLEGSMNGAEWWRVSQVLEQIIMGRGEKAAEVMLIENRRAKEMQRMKTDFIKDIITSKLKNQYKEQNNQTKPDLAKSISYAINSCKVKLFNKEKQFATLDTSGVHISTLIYSNRESKQDLDIERITIENLLDGDNYRWVLYPGAATNQYPSLRNRGPPRTMVQCRLKDKFIVVSEAPWRVYDQFEFDLFPSSIQLTRNLYIQFKTFLFDQYYRNRNEQSLNQKAAKGGEAISALEQQEKKYQLLVPNTKALPAKKKPVPTPVYFDDQSQDSVGGQGSSNISETRIPGFMAIIDHSRRTQDAQMVAQARKQGMKQQVAPMKKLTPQEFPVFFKYFRMNEISVTITYFHEKNSFLNTQDLRVRLSPYISHYKFMPFKKVFDGYESHTKKNFINQIPNILKQKLLKAKQKVDEVAHVGVTNSLIERVARVKDLAVGHVVVSQKLKKKKDKEKRKALKKKALGAGTGGDPADLTGDLNEMSSPPLRASHNNSSDESMSEKSSDSNEMLDEEERKAKEKYLQEIKETKLREARNILFGDFAAL